MENPRGLSPTPPSTNTRESQNLRVLIETRKKYFKNSKALLIGVSKYFDKQHITKLNYAHSDALAFDSLFTEFGFCDTVCLTNEKATKKNIYDHLNTFCKPIAQKAELVVIFWAGHGGKSDHHYDRNRTYLFPYEAEEAHQCATAISLKNFCEAVIHIYAQNILLILDTCYSKLAPKELASVSNTFNSFSEVSKNRFAICGGSASNQESYESDELERGVFSYYIHQGLSGQPNKKGERFYDSTACVNFLNLIQYTRSMLPEKQDPYFNSFPDAGKEMIVGQNIAEFRFKTFNNVM